MQPIDSRRAVIDEVRESRSHALFDRFRSAGNCAGAVLTSYLAWLSGTMKWDETVSAFAALYASGLLVVTNILPEWSQTDDRVRADRGRRRTVSMTIARRGSGSRPELRHRSYWGSHVSKLLNTEGEMWLFRLMSFYKMGEQGVLNLFPLYLMDSGYSLDEVALWTSFFPQVVSTAGTFLGVNGSNRSLSRTFQAHASARVVIIAAIWIAVAFWENFPQASYVGGLSAFSALFFVSASSDFTSYRLALLVSQRASNENRKEVFDLLVTGDLLGKTLFSAAMGGLVQLVGYIYVFALFVLISLLVLPCQRTAPVYLNTASVDMGL